MPDVRIEPSDRGGYRLTIDGVDMSNAVSQNGFRLTFERDRPTVSLELLPTGTLAGVFPDAVLSAIACPVHGCIAREVGP